jgi:hypothetical protein
VEDQIARNLTDGVDGILKGKRYLIHDRDPLFTPELLDRLRETSATNYAGRQLLMFQQLRPDLPFASAVY